MTGANKRQRSLTTCAPPLGIVWCPSRRIGSNCERHARAGGQLKGLPGGRTKDDTANGGKMGRTMSDETNRLLSVPASLSGAAVPGLTRSDLHAPGIIREPDTQGFHYRDASGRRVTDIATRERIAALSIPPAWKHVWISPDPLGHIQATGVDSRGRTQYRYHPMWREQREVQKFTHMLRFAHALPDLRTATTR